MRQFNPGVPLAHYLHEHQNVGVSFRCCACQAHHAVPIEQVVSRLKLKQLGDEATGICEVGRLSERPCRRCGKVR